MSKTSSTFLEVSLDGKIYLRLSDKFVTKTTEELSGLVVDWSADGSIVGVEFVSKESLIEVLKIAM